MLQTPNTHTRIRGVAVSSLGGMWAFSRPRRSVCWSVIVQIKLTHYKCAFNCPDGSCGREGRCTGSWLIREAYISPKRCAYFIAHRCGRASVERGGRTCSKPARLPAVGPLRTDTIAGTHGLKALKFCTSSFWPIFCPPPQDASQTLPPGRRTAFQPMRKTRCATDRKRA